MGNTFYFQWEVQLMEALQSILPKWSIAIVSFFTLFGEELMLIAILGILYWWYDKEIGKSVGICIVVANVFNPMIKNVALRRRPYMDNPGIQCLKQVNTEGDAMDVLTQGYSMPSGHATNAAALYSSLSYYIKNRRMSVAAGILIWLVAFSRVALGVHYPTDVLAGILCGLLVVFFIPLLRTRMKSRELLYLLLALLLLPGFFYCDSTDYYTGYGMMIGFFIGERIETKFVRFKNTKSVVRGLARVLVGGAVYPVLNTLLKLPFSSAFLDSGVFAAHAVRSVRYAVILAVLVGIYPMCFAPVDAWLDRIWKREPGATAKEVSR